MLKNIWNFYIDSFRNLNKDGKRLALIIIIKLIILFGIFKVFFFRDFLDSRYDTDKQKSEHIIKQLTND
jgi:hypothetical protein